MRDSRGNIARFSCHHGCFNAEEGHTTYKNVQVWCELRKLAGHRVLRGVRGSEAAVAVAVACRDGGEGCVRCGVCSTLLLLPLPPLVLPPLLLQGPARRGISAKEVFEDGGVHHRS